MTDNRLTATYSPEDNKLRLYSVYRLDDATYDRLQAAGFRHAPKQDLFVAPGWSPPREDLLLELCGEIGDEDTSLVERAEQRAARFEEYSDRRSEDARRRNDHARSIAAGIPLGQPIHVGHHSEARARRDVERIVQGSTAAVNLWSTSQYWADRARAAVRSAKYKQRPDVRYRRMRKLEGERRNMVGAKEEADAALGLWAAERLTLDLALQIARTIYTSFSFPLADYPRNPPASQYEGPMDLHSALQDGIVDAEGARDLAVPRMTRLRASAERWIAHYDHRIAYESAMLDEQGGIESDRTKPEVDGACKCWASPGYGSGWSMILKVNKVSVTIKRDFGDPERTITTTIPFDKLTALMTRAEVDRAKAEGRVQNSADGTGFFLIPTQHAEADTATSANVAP